MPLNRIRWWVRRYILGHPDEFRRHLEQLASLISGLENTEVSGIWRSLLKTYKYRLVIRSPRHQRFQKGTSIDGVISGHSFFIRSPGVGVFTYPRPHDFSPTRTSLTGVYGESDILGRLDNEALWLTLIWRELAPGIYESMPLVSEVCVLEALVRDGAFVEYGQPLYRIALTSHARNI
ncbi:MAG: hypothetical protein Q8Q20_00135 [bacterium]|nr:hypothetical protein [bacterium]